MRIFFIFAFLTYFAEVTSQSESLTIYTKKYSLDFSQTYPNLKSLEIHGASTANDPDMHHYYENCQTDLGLSNNKKLNELKLSFINLNGVLLHASLPSVKHLCISEHSSMHDFNILNAFPKLEHLDWFWCFHVNNEDWNKILAYGQSIKVISLYPLEQKLTKQDIAYMSQLNNLKKINLSLYNPHPEYVEKIKQTILSIIPNVELNIIIRWDSDFEGYLNYPDP